MRAFLGLLALLFIYLKLTGVILWSWWFVLAPLWFPIVLIFSAPFVAVFIGLLWGAFIVLVGFAHEQWRKKSYAK